MPDKDAAFWRTAVLSVGAAAALVLIIRRLQRGKALENSADSRAADKGNNIVEKRQAAPPATAQSSTIAPAPAGSSSTGHGSGHDHGGHGGEHDQGHSHGGEPCSGHGGGENQRDSHGGDHGHGSHSASHGDAQDHGHSHGGAPCSGHGNGQDDAHGHGGGLEGQRAAAIGAGGKPWAPDFDAPLETDVERRLRARYNPTYLDIENQGNSCGALKLAIVMVSEVFKGQTRINRQRDVQSVLRADLDNGRLHALSLMLKTPEEHQKLMAKQAEES